MGKLASLSALNPFGPIFGKELRTTARRKRTYWLRLLYLLGLFLFLLGTYSDTIHSGSGISSVAERAQAEAELGGAFFSTFSLFSVIALMVISPVLTATSVSGERQGKTLHVLLMTPISSWQIISGKLFSRMLTALTLIGLSLPVLAVVRLLGSVDVDRLIAVLAICIAASLATAAIGLFYSTFMNRAYAIILLSYATMLFLYAFIPFVGAMLYMNRARPPFGFFRFLAAVNPAINVGAMVIPGAPRGIGFLPCVMVQLGLAAVLVLWAGAVVRRLARRAGESPNAIAPQDYMPYAATVAPAMPLAPAATLAYAPRTLPRSRPAKVREVSDNPVLWREVRRPLMARRWQAIVGSIICIALLGITYICIAASGESYRNSSPLADPGVQTGYAVIFCGLFTLLICVISATSIAGEKESDTWTLLLATPIRGREIVMGKLLGILRRLIWPGVLIVGHFLIFTVCGVIPVWTLLLVLWMIFACTTTWIATGLYFSLRLRTVTFAVILNLLMPIMAYGLVALLLAILGNILSDRRSNWPDIVGLYAPYYYLTEGLNHLTRLRYSHQYDTPQSLVDLRLAFSNDNVTLGTFLWIGFVVGIGYLVTSALVLAYTIRRFDAIVGRAHQREPLGGGTSAMA